mgnify:CR=1 FL=1
MELAINKYQIKDNLIFKLIPYFIIIIFSIISIYPLFYEGYPLGDDYAFHYSAVLDLYTELKEGYHSSISANLASGYGIAKVLFYSPLSHTMCALLALILNGNIILSFKINYFISVLISGLVLYIFAHKISKNRFIALVSASFFIFYPYRLFDAICRIAYAEAYSFMFIPIFFLGLYEFVNLKKCEIKPFIEIIIGATGLYLSHNITALFGFLFGFIFLLFYIDKIFKLIIHDKRTIIYSVITIIIVLSFASIVLLSSFELLSLDYYNVSDSDRMWTSRSYVTNRFDFMNYSGFLNYKWLSGWNIDEIKESSLIFEIIFFISLVTLTYLVSFISKKICHKKYYFIFPLLFFAVLAGIFVRRFELILASVVFIILFLLSLLFNKKNNEKENRFGIAIYVLIVITLLMICFSFIWEIIPKIFLNIQFPWRLWAYFSFFSAIFIAYFTSRHNFLIPVSVFLASFMIVVSQPLVEKRTVHDNSDSWLFVVDETIYERPMSVGANLEYLPKSFYYNYSYKSDYEKSIHNKIQTEVDWYIGKNPYKIDPVILEGDGNIEVVRRRAPDYILNISLDESSLIEMPLFYYPGYKIEVLNLDNNEITNAIVLDIDSLISFRLDSGNYKVSFTYEGTNLQNLGQILNKSAFTFMILFYGFDIIYENKKNKMKIK